MAWRPILALLLVAPYLGEVLSTATSPLDLMLPWNLALFSALYGCGALLCREIAYRWGLGLPGLAFLGAAYGVYEEAVVDRFWFDPGYAAGTGVGDYSEVWHTNLLLATHLTAFHAAVSVCCSVLIVTWVFPADRDRAWVGPGGLVTTGVALLSVLFVTYEDYVSAAAGPDGCGSRDRNSPGGDRVSLPAPAVPPVLPSPASASGRGRRIALRRGAFRTRVYRLIDGPAMADGTGRGTRAAVARDLCRPTSGHHRR